MTPHNRSCAILADRHPALAEGVRNLLELTFQAVYIESDGPSLKDGAKRLSPALVILDISLPGGDFISLLKDIQAFLRHGHRPVQILQNHDCRRINCQLQFQLSQ